MSPDDPRSLPTPVQEDPRADETPAADGHLRLSRRVVRGDSYFLLFMLLLVDFAMSIITTEVGWTRIASAVLTGITLVAAIRISHTPRKGVIWGWVGMTTVVGAGILGEVLQNRALSAFVSGLVTVLLLLGIPIILRRLRQSIQVTFETVAGALCIYVIFGLVFAGILFTISLATDRCFLVAGLADHGPITRSDYYYFSFLTMTTLGYGDVVAANPLGRALATLEAVVGQVYLVTTVAWLVSVARPRHPRKSDAA